MTETATVFVDGLDADEPRPFRHLAGLDGLRAIAVILVVVFHYGNLWETRNAAGQSDGGLFPGGFIGVDVFFVLSGFLITSLLVGERAKTGSVSFAKFYARRAARLLPALVVLLIAFCLWSTYRGAEWSAVLKPTAASLFYVSNLAQVYFLKSMIFTGLSFTWSLAIEEQFYLVWPALLLFGVLRFARTRRAVLIAILGGAALSALLRIYVWNWGAGYPAASMRLDVRADGLLIGAACAFLWRWRMVPTKWLNEAAIACLVGLLGVTLLWDTTSGGMFQGGYTLVSLAVAVIILAIAENRFQLLGVLESTAMRAIGRVSYGIYLWHGLGLRIAGVQLKDEDKLVVVLVAVVITGVAVTLSWFVVEQPVLRLKDRLFASPVAH